MKARTSTLVAILCFALVLSSGALPQAPAAILAHASRGPVISDYKESDLRVAEPGLLESTVPRDGLRFYLEIRQGGLLQLAQSGAALAPLVKTLAGLVKISAQDFSAFTVSQMGALSRSRVALVNYGGSDTAALIEAAGPEEAESIKSALARLVGSNKTSPDAGLDVRSRDRLVVAGMKGAVSRLTASADNFALAEDQSFMKSRERFASDPFFAYAEFSSTLPVVPGMDRESAFITGALAAMANTPYALAMGGSFQGDSVHVRALAFFGSKESQGLMGGVLSNSASAGGTAVGPSFAPADADIFLDVMFDWDKLYDSLSTMFSAAMASMAQADSQSGQTMAGVDLFAALESQLGFSVKNDLIPTLGNELAISFADFARVLKPAPRPAAYDESQPQAPASTRLPRILVMVELRDQAKFEKLFMRILNPSNRPAVELAQETYRGAIIKSRPSLAFTVSKGFFFVGPSAAEIRRALDARALGNGLGATAHYRAAVGSPERAMLQGYFSPGVTNTLLKTMFGGVAMASDALKDFAGATTRTRSAVGISMWPDPDGFMVEMHLPSSLAMMGVAAMATTTPAPYGISSSGQRRTGGRRTPKLTDDDVRNMRKP